MTKPNKTKEETEKEERLRKYNPFDDIAQIWCRIDLSIMKLEEQIKCIETLTEKVAEDVTSLIEQTQYLRQKYSKIDPMLNTLTN